MPVHVDFSGADEYQFPDIPTGTYHGVIDSWEQRDSQSSEYPYIAVKVQIDVGEFSGQSLILRLSTSPKASWKIKGTFKALGFDVSGLGETLDIEEYLNSLPGTPVRIIIKTQQYQGNLRPYVDQLLLDQGSGPAPTSPAPTGPATPGAPLAPKRPGLPKIR